MVFSLTNITKLDDFEIIYLVNHPILNAQKQTFEQINVHTYLRLYGIKYQSVWYKLGDCPFLLSDYHG